MGKSLETDTSRTQWEAPDGTTWTVQFTWAELNGRVECVGLALLHPDHMQPITSMTWRAVPVRQLIDGRRTFMDRALGFWEKQAREERPRRMRDADAFQQTRKKWTAPRARKLVGADGHELSTEDALAEVARIYREAWRAGLNPTKAVADALKLSRSAAAKRVRRARDAHLLPDTTRGRATAAGEEE